jgi:hypothetical protein
MKITLLNIILLILAAIFMLPIAVTACSSSDITWHGYLMDSDTAKLPHKASDALDFVQNYDSKTALSAKSQAAGYMLFADKWYHLDKHGNELAIDVIKRSIKHKGFYVIVGGKLKDNTIAVARLIEIIDTPILK